MHSTTKGYSARRWLKVRKCCSASTVVGTSTATCLPLSIGLEGGAHGQLGLAVADVAADEPVHRPGALHVALDLGERRQLVGRFLVGEGSLELGLPVGVGRKGDAWLGLAQGLQLDHVAGQVEDGRLNPCFLCCQLSAAELRQLRIRLGAADVLLHQVDLGRRHVDADALPKFEDQVLFGLTVLVEHLHAAVASDAVADVNDKIVLGQVEKAVDGARLDSPPRQNWPRLVAMKQLVVTEDNDAVRPKQRPKARTHVPDD